ncbi:MAG: DUF58 domain-containing protein [Fuerstiella sp.]
MTGRSRWLVLMGMAGFGLGVLRNQHTLAGLSLTVLVWLFVEWVMFYSRVWFELPRLQLTRSVNGRTEGTGFLWSGRRVRVVVTFSTTSGTIGPLLTIRDCLPENLMVRSGVCEHTKLTRNKGGRFSYEAEIGGAGRALLPGFRIRMQDPQGFFTIERFIPVEQNFRVLPAYADLSETQPLVKRINSLPQHGIHRLQRAGMGSELLELREYVPGDPPKSIAWKVSARRQTLMTRQYESEVPVRVYLFVDGSISTRVGGFGQRLLDQMMYVAGTVARSAISAGDPVGAVLFDERARFRIAPAGGDRGFYRLLETLSDFAVNPPPPQQRLSNALINAAMRLAGERHPELLDPKVNQVPFTFLPILPWKRRDRYRRTLLAGVLAQRYRLSPTQLLELVHDDRKMASAAQQFLADAGVAWMDPLLATRSRGFHDGMATMELCSKAITEAVRHARDNEVYVVMANLLECATNISHVMPAVKMALARHHRVIFVCPTPGFRRPGNLPEPDEDPTAEALLARAEDLRTHELAARLQRALRRVGASVTLSGEQQAVRLILAETELARSGRIAFTGGP